MLRRLLHRLLFRSLRTTLLVLVLIIPVPILLAEGVSSLLELRHERKESLESNLEVARATSRLLQSYFEDVQRQALAVGVALDCLRPASNRELLRLLQTTAPSIPGVYAMCWRAPDGRILAATDPSAAGTRAAVLARAKEFHERKEWAVSDLSQSAKEGRPTLSVYRAVRNTKGALVGIVETSVDPEGMRPLFEGMRLEGRSIIVRDRRGFPVVGAPFAQWTWEGRQAASKLPLVEQAAAGREVSGIRDPVLPRTGQRLLTAAAPVGSTGWSAWAGQPEAQALAPHLRWRYSEGGVLLFVAGLGLLGALRISKHVVEPILKLRDHAADVGRGNLHGRVDVLGPAELRLLADSLNGMTDALRNREAERELTLGAERGARADAEAARAQTAGILESITDAFISVDSEGRTTYFNRAAERVLRTEREAALGKVFWELFDGDFADQLRLECRSSLSEGRPAEFTALYPPLSVWLDIHVYPSAGGLSLYMQDITERHLAAVALEESERRLEEAQRLGRMGHWEFDLETRLVTWSDEVFRLYGRDPALGPPSVEENSEYYHPEDWPRLTASMERAAKTGERQTGDYRMRLGSGASAHHFVLVEPVCDGGGRVTKLAGIVQDITERKGLEEELRRARDAAETANRTKSEFLANMSHEVRTPLSSVLGLTDLVLRSRLTDDQRRLLGLAQDSAESLLQVIGDILDFSKIEAGKLEFDQAEFDVRAVVEAALDGMAPSAHRKGLELFCRVASEVPRTLIGDRTRLQQVIVNLVGNAVKFTADGEVSVRVSAPVDPAVESSRCLLHVAVQDTGIGIARDDMDRLFESFSQVDASLTRRHSGTGLGLAICRRLVEAMGGAIGVESTPGKGSVFFFTALFGRADVDREEVEPEAPLAGVRALVVADGEGFRRLLTELLTEFGARATGTDAGEALAALQAERRVGAPHDLVLLDRRLTGTDGFLLAEAIGREAEPKPRVLLLLPVHDLIADTRRCSEDGGAGYIVKPVKRAELLRACCAALGREVPAQPSQRTEEVPEPLPKDLSVLLADDNPTAQLLMQMLLAEQGWRVATVGTGRAALEALAGIDPFDVVLMDVQMPEMDGLTATRILRDREALRESETGEAVRVPIIGLTAHALKGDREKCLEAGMDDYLPKPVEAGALYAAVAKWSKLFPARKPAAAACDLSGLLTGLKGNEAAVRKLAGTFLEDLPGRVEALRAALAAGDAIESQRAAHALRGGLLLFGAKASGALGGRIEELAKKEDLAEASAALPKLERELERVKAFLLAL